jgi:hypothetical protein
MMSLAAPLLLAYLTYTSVGSSAQLVTQMTQVAPTSTHKKASGDEVRPEKRRNPFDQDFGNDMTDLLAGPLSEGMKQGKASTEKEAEPLRLNGTVLMGSWKMAIINGRRLHEGDQYEEMRLAVIAQDKVIFIDRLGQNVSVQLDVAKSDEIQRPDARKKKGPTLAEQAPLQRGVSALTASSQGEILDMLDIPKN